MYPRITPSISWNSPKTILFNTNVINTSYYSKEAIFSPMRPPRISHYPIFYSFFHTESNNTDVMYYICISSSIIKNTTSIVIKSIRNSYTTGNWTPLINFLSHILFSSNKTELFYIVYIIAIWNKARTAWVAVQA